MGEKGGMAMLWATWMFRIGAGKNDRKRNASTTFPQGVAWEENLHYGPDGKHHMLNVYYPQGTEEPLPTIVSVHGGGYVYGNKETYHFYCADLARRGFTVVNLNYRLAPRWKFPAPLEDLNRALTWMIPNARRHNMDPNRVFLVGDSAGAQIISQYGAIATNPAYAARFSFRVPQVKIRAMGLNCGMYDMASLAHQGTQGLLAAYLGRKARLDDPRLDVLGGVTEDYPPSYVLTGSHDFLRDNAQTMAAFLQSKGVEAVWKCYGTPEQKEVGHVFHVDIRLPEATVANDEQCAFFRRW